MKNLTGPDASIETSLKEYGAAWEEGKDCTRFYYGIGHNGVHYVDFDWMDMENDIDVHEEYDFVDFEMIAQSACMSLADWDALPLVYKIQDMVGYYGVTSIYRDWNYAPITYGEVIE